MGAGRYLLFMCGQLGIMALARFFFQWVIRAAGGDPESGIEPLFAVSAVGLLFLGFRIFDGVTDPLAGALSDGWVRRGRERRSLLWASFWLPGLGLALIFAPSHEMGAALRWTLLSSGMLLFFVGYTLYAIPYWSLIADYSAGDKQVRSQLSNLLGAGTLVATGLGFVVSPLLVDHFGFFTSAAIFAVPCAVLMLLPYWAAPRARAAPAATVASSPKAPSASGLRAFRTALSHRRFLAIVLLFAGGQMSFSVMTAAAPYIAVELLGGTLKDVATLLGPFLLTAVPCFFLIPRLTARWGWERLVVVASALLAFVYAGAGGLGAALVVSPVVTAGCLFAAAGPMAAVLLGVEGDAVAACAEEKPGELTSVYFGVFNLVVKALNGVAVALTGAMAELVVEHGAPAVRAMPFSAGGLLLLGVLAYLGLRRPAPSAAGTAQA